MHKKYTAWYCNSADGTVFKIHCRYCAGNSEYAFFDTGNMDSERYGYCLFCSHNTLQRVEPVCGTESEITGFL